MILNLRKLITTFLVLAIATTSTILIFSQSKLTYSSPADQEAKRKKEGEGAIALGENVFVEPLPETGASGDSENLTEGLLGTLAEEIVKTNPQNLLEGAQGSFSPPNPEELTKLLDKKIASLNLGGLEPEIPLNTLTVIWGKHTPEEADQYIEGTARILKETTNSPRYKILAQGEPSLEAAQESQAIFEEAARRLKAIRVPLPLVKLHQSLLVFLGTQQKIFETIANYTADPAKTVVLSNRDGKKLVAESFQKYEGEFKKIKFVRQTSKEKGEKERFSFLRKILGIQEARAFFGVPIQILLNADPATQTFHGAEVAATSGNWVQKLFEWARTLGTEILRNQIIHNFVAQILNWVRGGGKPQFITNWKGFVNATFNRAAGSIIESLVPELCGPIGALARIALKPIPSVGTTIGCTLDRIGVNIERFYNRFSEGSWIAFGSSFKPGVGFFPSISHVRDISLKAGSQEKETAKSEGESGKGFLSAKICVEQQDIVDPSTGEVTTICTKEQVTTPGGFIADATKKAVADSPVDKVVNAKDMQALVSGIVDSYLNKLIQAGVAGITGAFADDEEGPVTVNTSAGGGGSCTGLSGPALSACLGIGSGSGQTALDQPPPPGPIPDFSYPISGACTSVADPPCSEFGPGQETEAQACIDACYP